MIQPYTAVSDAGYGLESHGLRVLVHANIVDEVSCETGFCLHSLRDDSSSEDS